MTALRPWLGFATSPLGASPDTGTLLLLSVLVVLGLLTLALLAGSTLMLFRWRQLSASDADAFRATPSGPVELVGPASPAPESDSFRAGVSGIECLVSEIDVQSYQSSGQSGGSWVTEESRTTTRPFHVETPGGIFRVEPDGARLVLDSNIVDELDAGEDATGRTAAFLDAIGVERTTGSVDLKITKLDYGDRTRIREGRVDVGEEVYVAGSAVTDDPTVGGFGGPDAVVRARPDRSRLQRLFDFPFVIGDGGEKAVRWHFLKRALGFAAVALLFGGVWVVIAAVALG
jgi:hypothetical protein